MGEIKIRLILIFFYLFLFAHLQIFKSNEADLSALSHHPAVKQVTPQRKLTRSIKMAPDKMQEEEEGDFLPLMKGNSFPS